jgi:hypothetical protein
MILAMADSPGIKHLRQLVAKREQITEQIDASVAGLLREGEFVEDIADALGESREKVRRVRVALGIPDAREIRRAKGSPARRSSGD